MGKYAPLFALLKESSADIVQMTFKDIADLVGDLPPSASRYREWWANETEGAHVQCHAWLDAGYRVEAVNLTAEKVNFRRA